MAFRQSNSKQELILVDDNLPKPKYLQIVENIIISIEKGIISRGDQLPSISELAEEYQLAKATVSKSYDELKARGVIMSKHGKGFYVASTKVRNEWNVFVLFDTFNAYKEVLYNAFKNSLPVSSQMSVYFHHYNKKLFASLIENNLGNFNSYVIMPHFDTDVSSIVAKIPKEKLLIIDKDIPALQNGYASVFQDFEKDAFNSLMQAAPLLRKYEKLIISLGKDHFQYIPSGIIAGIKKFAKNANMPVSFSEQLDVNRIKTGEAYLLFSDSDLVKFVKQVYSHKWQVGSDIGLISYDDTPLKEILLNGITTISTDFELMGKTAARMIVENTKVKFHNPSKLIIRQTL
ncbi:GntR family transcriptional regulator [Flavitalea flava]